MKARANLLPGVRDFEKDKLFCWLEDVMHTFKGKAKARNRGQGFAPWSYYLVVVWRLGS